MDTRLLSRVVQMTLRCHRHNPPLAAEFLEDLRATLRDQRQAELDRPIGESFSIDLLASNIASALCVPPEEILDAVQAEWFLSYVPLERLLSRYDHYFNRGCKWPGDMPTNKPSGLGGAKGSKSAPRAARKGGQQ